MLDELKNEIEQEENAAEFFDLMKEGEKECSPPFVASNSTKNKVRKQDAEQQDTVKVQRLQLDREVKKFEVNDAEKENTAKSPKLEVKVEAQVE